VVPLISLRAQSDNPVIHSVMAVTKSCFHLACLLMPARRFPPPWSVEETEACFSVNFER
jgi:hypothetical protein